MDSRERAIAIRVSIAMAQADHRYARYMRAAKTPVLRSVAHALYSGESGTYLSVAAQWLIQKEGVPLTRDIITTMKALISRPPVAMWDRILALTESETDV